MSTSTSERLYRIELDWACFGLVELDGRIIRAAPIAKWQISEPAFSALWYWIRRGAKVELVKEGNDGKEND